MSVIQPEPRVYLEEDGDELVLIYVNERGVITHREQMVIISPVKNIHGDRTPPSASVENFFKSKSI
jgi:hypothetical protein